MGTWSQTANYGFRILKIFQGEGWVSDLHLVQELLKMKSLLKVLDNIGGICTGLLFLLVLIQVLSRIVLNLPTSWSVELGRVFFLTIVFIGSAYLFYSNGHMVIKAVYERLSGKTWKTIELINNGLMLIGLFFFLVGAFKKTVSNWNIVIPTLEWMTNGYMYLIVFIGGLNMFFFVGRKFVNTLRGKI